MDPLEGDGGLEGGVSYAGLTGSVDQRGAVAYGGRAAF